MTRYTTSILVILTLITFITLFSTTIYAQTTIDDELSTTPNIKNDIFTSFPSNLDPNAQYRIFSVLNMDSNQYVANAYLSIQFTIDFEPIQFDFKNMIETLPHPVSKDRFDHGKLMFTLNGAIFKNDTIGFAYISIPPDNRQDVSAIYPGTVFELPIPETVGGSPVELVFNHITIREAMVSWCQLYGTTRLPKGMTVDIVIPTDGLLLIAKIPTYQVVYMQRVENIQAIDEYYAFYTPSLSLPLPTYSTRDVTKFRTTIAAINNADYPETIKFDLIYPTGTYAQKYDRSKVVVTAHSATRLYQIIKPSVRPIYSASCSWGASGHVDSFFWTISPSGNGTLGIQLGSFDKWPRRLSFTCDDFLSYQRPGIYYYSNGIDAPTAITHIDRESKWVRVKDAITQTDAEIKAIPMNRTATGYLRYTFLNPKVKTPLAFFTVVEGSNNGVIEFSNRFSDPHLTPKQVVAIVLGTIFGSIGLIVVIIVVCCIVCCCGKNKKYTRVADTTASTPVVTVSYTQQPLQPQYDPNQQYPIQQPQYMPPQQPLQPYQPQPQQPYQPQPQQPYNYPQQPYQQQPYQQSPYQQQPPQQQYQQSPQPSPYQENPYTMSEQPSGKQGDLPPSYQ